MPDTGMSDQSRLDMPEPEYRRRVNPEKPDPSMRKLALGAVAVCALVLGGVWVLSVKNGPHQVPVVQPDPKPLRVKPKNPGGMQVDGLDDAMLNGGAGAGTDKLAPPPEVPAPQALAAQEGGVPTPDGRAPAGPAVMPPQALTPGTQPLAYAAPALAAPPPMTEAPAAPAAPVAPSTAVASMPNVPHPIQVPAPPMTVPANAAGVAVQLGALPSRPAAVAEWRRLVAKIPGAFAGHRPKISSVTHDGRVLWRLRTDGFADIASATAFCGKARAAGAACTIADF